MTPFNLNRWHCLGGTCYLQFKWQRIYSVFSLKKDAAHAFKRWYQAPIWVSRPIFLLFKIIFRQLRFSWCRATSLTRGRVCSLQLLLGLASAVFLGSEDLESYDYILLSQFLDPLPQPGGPGSCTYFPKEQGSPVILPGIEFRELIATFPFIIYWVFDITLAHRKRSIQQFFFVASLFVAAGTRLRSRCLVALGGTRR
jgi:hypothetical protein